MVYGPKEGIPQHMGDFYDWVVNGNTPTAIHTAVLSSHQNYFLRSQNNPFLNGAYRNGGRFLSQKIERVVNPSARVITYRNGWSKAYDGRYTFPAPDPVFPSSLWGTSRPDRPERGGEGQWFAALEARGAEAWACMRPDKPDFTMASSLYELKDFVPELKSGLTNLMDLMDRRRPGGSGRNRRSPVSRTAQYYLALKFGWLPLLSDIRNFVEAQRTKQKRLDQLIRDNGRPVRRKCTDIRDPGNTGRDPAYDFFGAVPNGYGANYAPVHVTQCYTGWGYVREHVDKTSRIWAEGSFQYFLPPGPQTVAWKKKMLRRIMGQRVTPLMVYNIIPWSWLVDYFADLGKFIEATSSGVSDRLVANYAYLMQETHWTRHTEKQGMTYSDVSGGNKPNVITMSSSTDVISKGRSRASPFGWGFNQNSLTPTQVAILGALGLSRLP